MKEIYELDVYKLAETLSDLIWYAFDEWSEKVKKTIGYQIIKSADSIAANLAEGYGRYTPGERSGFITIQEALLKKPRLGCVNSFEGKS